MRIISQCGLKDIPYENKKLRVADLTENCYSIVVGMCVVGDYTSREKALKVMEMIRVAYNNYTNTTQYNEWLGRMKYPENISTVYTHFEMPQDSEV